MADATSAPGGQVDGQLRLFERDEGYTFMRCLNRGDVFTVGVPGHHSAPFTVTANRPTRQVMGIEYVNHKGERKTSTWTYADHDVCMVSKRGELPKGKRNVSPPPQHNDSIDTAAPTSAPPGEGMSA
jgi:hypothetical protein